MGFDLVFCFVDVLDTEGVESSSSTEEGCREHEVHLSIGRGLQATGDVWSLAAGIFSVLQ